MKIEVSNSEIFDKHSILEIKQEKGLDVANEKEEVQKAFIQILENFPLSQTLFNVLKTINIQLWEIEDMKRSCEIEKDFGLRFINLSRLVYMINDERARITRLIDIITNSSLDEKKRHRNY